MGKASEDLSLVVNNSSIYQFYRSQLINLALSQFDYQNLPDTIDTRYMEWVVLSQGSCAVYQVAGTDIWLATSYRVDAGKGYTPYGQPRHIVGIDAMGRQHLVEPGKFFIVYDSNLLGIMTAGGSSGIIGYGASAGATGGIGATFGGAMIPKINHQAALLYETHQTMRSNLMQQNRPYVVRTTRNEQLSIENLFKKIFNFSPVVEVRDSMNIKDMVDTIDLRVQFIGKDLLEVRREIWNDALGMLGIAAETSKKERLIADEVATNNQEDTIALNSRLQNRRRLCEWLGKQGFAAHVEMIKPEAALLVEPQVAGHEGGSAATMGNDTDTVEREPDNG